MAALAGFLHDSYGSVLEGSLPVELSLRHASHPIAAEIGWRLEGANDAPVIAVMGGISASRNVAAETEGWWPKIVGPCRALDTNRCRVLSFDFLGSDPHLQLSVPIDTRDQAQVLEALCRHLAIENLLAVVGASYGAMVALACGARFGERIGRIVAVSGAHKPHPLSSGWRSIQRRIVRLGLASGADREAVSLARQLAMTTYRTAAEFAARFYGPASIDRGFVRLPVENYLEAQGKRYAAATPAQVFLRLSESIDVHAIDPASVNAPVTLIAFAEDQLVPLESMQDLARQLGERCELHVLNSVFGHDAFLKESAALTPLLASLLENT